jgi:methanogenic corrinoid protein MtbC1
MDSVPQEHSAPDGGNRGRGNGLCQDLPVFALSEAANDTRIAKLARAIEQEIIPRLMLAHRALPGTPARPVDLLAPSARYLGDLWERDLCSFTDVTIGLGRLQRILREQSPAFSRTPTGVDDGRSILLVPSPGEQHTLGLVMVGEFFRRAGWNVSGGAWTAGVDAAGLVRDEWFDAIGFSLGAEVHLQQLGEIITAVRQASCNPKITVLVGGPLFGENPGFWEQVGADGMTVDGREAPALADQLIARRAGQGSAQRA